MLFYDTDHLKNIHRFFVAEKSDGVRCLALLTVDDRKEPEVYLVRIQYTAKKKGMLTLFVL